MRPIKRFFELEYFFTIIKIQTFFYRVNAHKPLGVTFSKDTIGPADDLYMDDFEEDSEISPLLELQEKRSFRLPYHLFLWLAFLLVTVLCVIDRFVGTGDVVLRRPGW